VASPSAAASSPSATTVQAAASTEVAVLHADATPKAPPLPADPVVGLLTEVFTVVNNLILPNPTVPPSNPLQLLAFEVVRRIEVQFGFPVIGTVAPRVPDPVVGSNPVSTATGVLSAGDVVDTPFGDIGKWLIQPNGQISNYGNQQFGGKTLLEPVNLIILDSGSSTSAEATAKLNADMGAAGFPAQAIHSTGFLGVIDGTTYGQQPNGLLTAYSDNFFLLPDDHARVFGPDPVQEATGFVWTVAASRELFGLNGLIPAHTYVSYNEARDELASRLIASGATLVGIVPMSNAVDSAGATTGDHDGYAIVIRLGNPVDPAAESL
jgi:hypothetical protein